MHLASEVVRGILRDTRKYQVLVLHYVNWKISQTCEAELDEVMKQYPLLDFVNNIPSANFNVQRTNARRERFIEHRNTGMEVQY